MTLNEELVYSTEYALQCKKTENYDNLLKYLRAQSQRGLFIAYITNYEGELMGPYGVIFNGVHEKDIEKLKTEGLIVIEASAAFGTLDHKTIFKIEWSK